MMINNYYPICITLQIFKIFTRPLFFLSFSFCCQMEKLFYDRDFIKRKRRTTTNSNSWNKIHDTLSPFLALPEGTTKKKSQEQMCSIKLNVFFSRGRYKKRTWNANLSPSKGHSWAWKEKQINCTFRLIVFIATVNFCCWSRTMATANAPKHLPLNRWFFAVPFLFQESSNKNRLNSWSLFQFSEYSFMLIRCY